MGTGWRLGVTLALLAAGASVVYLVPPVNGSVNPVGLYALPLTLGAWTGAEGAPNDALPVDPNEQVAVRRTYRSGPRFAWLSVAHFAGQDEEARRASVNRIYPQRGVSLIQPVPFSVTPDGASARAIALPAVVIHLDGRRLIVVYWHQIGRRAYGSEYGFRLALMRNIIFLRRADALLVRIAVPAAADSQVRESLDAAGQLAAPLYAALTGEARP
jgi:EpsI family protein